MTPSRPQVPLRVLAAAARTPRFWLTLARHLVPLVGVLAFGWSAMNVAIFFVLESWLFLSSRATVEVTFDPHFAGADLPTSRADALKKTVWMFVLASIACGVLVLGFGGIMVIYAFPAEEWRSFLTAGWRRPSFQLSLLALIGDVLFDAIDLQRRLVDRTQAERRADDLRVRVMFYRVGALLVACLVIGVASSLGIGGPVLVAVISLILVYVELFPQRAVKIFD